MVWHIIFVVEPGKQLKTEKELRDQTSEDTIQITHVGS